MDADDGPHAPSIDEAKEAADDLKWHLPTAQHPHHPGKAQPLEGFALISTGYGGHAGDGRVVAAEANSIAWVGRFTEDSIPQRIWMLADGEPIDSRWPKAVAMLGPHEPPLFAA